MQLVFPQDELTAIAVEGLSSSETAEPGEAAEEIADLVLYFGEGETFATSRSIQIAQFKYRISPLAITASYLRKTIEKFASSINGFEKDFSADDVDRKLTFAFVTNATFSAELWEAIRALKSGDAPTETEALKQYKYLEQLCKRATVNAQRLFSRCEFRASQDELPVLNSSLRRTMADWSAGADLQATARVFELAELVRERSGSRGQRNNLIRREDVFVALNCEPEDLFPADTRFIDVGEVVPRKQLSDATDLIKKSTTPIFIHAEGGVGKTVFVESLAATMADTYEVVVFDCFGGGAYRSQDQARHLPRVGFIQLANELASRGLCDPLLPGSTDSVAIVKAMRRRLTQAVATLKSQSKNEGLLVVIDAADNAVLEANARKDPAFPKLLLASLGADPIDGLKLVLTARTHRMPDVVERSKTVPFPLLPFSAQEAETFLNSRVKEISSAEFATAFSRSRGNARVLAYLVETWAANVVEGENKTEITVEQLIADKCQKIFADLHIAGWPDNDVREFFAAISLLPPPIPLEELASALGWSTTQVKSAASDLAPMLEIVPHGAIFRDEPTETYVHDTYSNETASQQAIAQRLQETQATSAYAAEALPTFLVAINDSDRAYALANSSQFPAVIQSDFGKRRLTLARLNAAFKLAVRSGDLDRVLGVTMRLAQVAAANSRGDQFIRRSPSLAIILGDPDASRRLFNDRSGWRGARDARLTVAHAFSKEMDEAEIHCERTVRWINWNARRPKDQDDFARSRSGPEQSDFAAVLFLDVLQREFDTLDRRLCGWGHSFALSVARETIRLARQYERATGTDVVEPLAEFASSTKCNSFALKVGLIKSATGLTSQRRKSLARSLNTMRVQPEKNDRGHDGIDADIIYAAFAALIHDGPTSAARILRAVTQVRPSSYDYGERHGHTGAWLPVLHACVAAWSQKRAVAIYDLLPLDAKLILTAKGIAYKDDCKKFLAALVAPRRRHVKGKSGGKPDRRFNDRECDEICSGIEAVLQIIEPLQTSMLARGNDKGLTAFLVNWRKQFSHGLGRRFEEPHHLLSRAIGLEFAKLLLRHAPNVAEADATQLIDIVSDQRFMLSERASVLALFANRPNLHARSGAFAQSIAEGIRKDDYIEQRGEDYASLAEALLEMSVAEAREYYRCGLSELDKLGSNDYDLIYSILRYAATQPGGLIRPDLGQRLMNLSQTICANEPSKFGWTLFGRACARSVGTTAATKLVRWDDQDVADFSYGLPQLACFLANERRLSPQRAAALVTVCEDHGWHEWRVGDGLTDLLSIATDADERKRIFSVVFRKLRIEHASGGWTSIWDGLLTLADKFPGVVSESDIAALRELLFRAEAARDSFNARSSPHRDATLNAPTTAAKTDPEEFIDALVKSCDPKSSSSIDDALNAIEANSVNQPFPRGRFFEKLRAACGYGERVAHISALAGITNIPIESVIDHVGACVTAWAASSVHLVAQLKSVIGDLFKHRGSELFDLTYGSVSRELHKLAELCGDAKFVLEQALNTIATERLELDGEQWMQLATVLCQQTSPTVAQEALETLLLGPAAGLADELGEGPHKAAFQIDDECQLVSGIMWHLLGDTDAYVRWATARALSTFVDLNLFDELNALLDDFDRTNVSALITADQRLCFQNSRQWLLMGLARAALIHGPKLASIKPRLLLLAARTDLHVLHKLHILRCLVNIGSDESEIAALRTEVTVDPKGVATVTGWPEHIASESGFSFDYEFAKSEVSSLARLFWISEGKSVDAIAREIQRLWPDATSMDYFPGHDRYRRERTDRHEFYREHLQKHGMLSAATTLRRSLPVARQSYDTDAISPFSRWLKDYDVTFADGSWLADHKDEMPTNAHASFMGPQAGNKETIVECSAVFERLGLTSCDSTAMVPIYANWRSPDGVYIRIVSALGARRGIVGHCAAFANVPDHDLWLPTFWNDGVDDPRRERGLFEPFIWDPEYYGLGVDSGEKTASRGAAARPRLGIALTTEYGLVADADGREWRTANKELALRSQIWGEWVPDADNYQHQRNEDGEILWAAPDWLDQVLSKRDQQLVYLVKLEKYRDTRAYSDGSGAKAVYIGTRQTGKSIRFWFAKKASAKIY